MNLISFLKLYSHMDRNENNNQLLVSVETGVCLCTNLFGLRVSSESDCVFV